MSPSDVSTPFSRRFGDEGQRSLNELRALYEDVSRRYGTSLWAKPNIRDVMVETTLKDICNVTGLSRSSPLIDPLAHCIHALLAAEPQIFEPIDADLSQPINLQERIDLHDRLRERARFLETDEHCLDLLFLAFRETAKALASSVPQPPRSGLTVPLYTMAANLPEVVRSLIAAYVAQEHDDAHVFASVSETLYRNLCRASGVRPESPSTKPLISPVDADMRPPQLVEAYLGDTPLYDLLHAPYPFELPAEQRFAGHWIIAPPGRGKTTLLHAMVADDIRRDAAIILMDSKGDLIEPFRNMKSIADRLIIIDPDPARPIAINPLDIPQTGIGKAVELLEYLFASLLEFKLTPTQTLLFRNTIRFLVTQYKNPNLDLFREFLADGWDESAKLPHAKYRSLIGRLDPHLRDFFHRDFGNENYTARRREVLQRLQLLLDNDAMRAMLSSTFTRFTFDEALDAGKIIIINNSKEKLGDHGAEFFGRFFIAQILATAQRRSSRHESAKKPVYFYLDECQNVIARDEKIPTILDECRSQRIALILAHQRTSQIKEENVLSALQNCAIRFANSDSEARKLAGSLRTSQDFLESLDRGQFAAYIRDYAKTAIAVGVVKPEFAADDRLTREEAQQLTDKIMQQYGRQMPTPSVSPPSQKPKPRSNPSPEKKSSDLDSASEW
jgi:hypothetical protein